MKILLYCCKNKPYLTREIKEIFPNSYNKYSCFKIWNKLPNAEILNGKIVAECEYEVEEITKKHVKYFEYCYITESLNEWELMHKSLLNGVMMNDYLQGNKGYAIHIKNLDIWNKPKSLERMGVKSSIKNMTKVLALRVVGFTVERFIIIPVKSELMHKILNSECSIIIRKKVLKEML